MYDDNKIDVVFSLGITFNKENFMNKVLKVVGMMAVLAAVFFVGDAFAQEIFKNASTAMGKVFDNVRTIVFIMGAFALVGFAVAAIFGKLEWKKVAILAVGLALLAVASQVVKYAVSVGADGGGSGADATFDVQDNTSL